MPTTSPLSDAPEYGAEMRFGIVMYGGVSLAIYINGVTSELFEMACATPSQPWPVRSRTIEDASTREVYRRLALLADNPTLCRKYAAALEGRPTGRDDVWIEPPPRSCEPTRFVVDVIAGTSAGGINGIFLAKALVQGVAFAPLARLWIDTGDIGKLLNDRRGGAAPASLLDSDLMYSELLDALKQMAPLGTAPAEDGGSPLVDELDLFVTTTDIVGAPVPLRLFDQVVVERRHKQRFHFSYPSRVARPDEDIGRDFSPANDPFLAFAARCTSSFPFAFEPMSLRRMADLAPGVRVAALDDWKPYFDTFAASALANEAWVDRAFGDGGYLDNKPFSYVVEALSQRFGDVPVRRKLLYVEPDPERLDAVRGARPRTPNAIENAIDALIEIPLYETIREDLQVILQRNRRIERVERIVRLGEADIEHAMIEKASTSFAGVRLNGKGEVPQWRDLGLADMVRYFGDAYLPYQRLRVYSTTDWIAEQLAGAWGVDPASDTFYALRALTRHLRERRYADNPAAGDPRSPVNAFLDDYDFDYRVRRLSFLLRRIDQITQMLQAAPPLNDLDTLLAAKLQWRIADIGGGSAETPLDAADRARLVDMLRQRKRILLQRYRELLSLRRERVRGAQLASELALDADIRAEMSTVLRALIGQAPGTGHDAWRLKLTPVPADGGAAAAASIVVDLPPAWAVKPAAASDLQDIIFGRVIWLAAQLSAGPEALVWKRLEEAATKTRVKKDPSPSARPLQALLNDIWFLLYAPQLTAREGRVVVDVSDRLAPAGAPTPSEQALRQLIGEYYLVFDTFDQMRFPLYYDTETGEPATVDVIRISPVDATSLRQLCPDLPKLAGTKLAHFGAFLDANWRRNDIMWGRLDGAERLVHTALPDADDATRAVRAELVSIAHGRILDVELVRPARARLTGLLTAAVAEVATQRGDDRERLRMLLDELDLKRCTARDALAQSLEGLLREDQLVWYVSTRQTFAAEPPPAQTLRNAGRAVAISGRLLEGIAKARNQATAGAATRWLARVGLVLQGVVAVSVPGALGRRWWSYAVRVIYMLLVTLWIVAFVAGSSSLRSAATTVLLLTGAIHLATLLVGDYVDGRNRWLRVGAVAGGLAFATAAALGVVGGLYYGSELICKPAAAWLPKLAGLLRLLCG
jgi:patatin-related protein